ncbi:MAG: DMT family transporter [Acidobacteriaceae bacterium]|jgi:drug/metabolite transporter (DMT)-like permease
MPHRLSHLGAMAFALAGFTLWVFTDTAIKLVGQTGLPWYEVLAFLGLFMVLFLIGRGLWRHDLGALRPHRLRSQFLRSGLDLGNNICVIVALRHLTLTLFYILIFLAPITVSLLSSVFLRERLAWHKALAILTGFAGVVIAVHPWSGSRDADWIGYTACFVCVACFSVNMVWSRVLTQTENPESLTLFSGAVMTVVGFSLMAGFRLTLPHTISLTPRIGALLVAVGVLCATGSLCFFVALKNTAAANVSQIHYTQLVTGAIMAWLVWRQAPTLLTIAGAVLIIASGLYIATVASQDHHSTWISPPVHPD